MVSSTFAAVTLLEGVGAPPASYLVVLVLVVKYKFIKSHVGDLPEDIKCA